ncbi:MAG: hypothetical protein OXG04_06275 [Acidobacteria bacterium]|nr:hypothetical protein [Acidobacteriota bacterium]
MLFAVASGHGAAPAIAAVTELPERNLPYYLQQLVNLGYLRRRYPLDRRRPNPKQVRFGIDDPLLRFWFRFVFPNMSAIRGSGPERVLGDRIAPSLEAWFGSCFERLCREALPLIYAMEGVTAGFEVGEYWGARRRNTSESPSPDASPAAQIDIVGLRDDNWTDLGECNWGGFGRRRLWKRSSTARRGSTPTAAAPRWAVATSCAASRARESMRKTGTRCRTCTRCPTRHGPETLDLTHTLRRSAAPVTVIRAPKESLKSWRQ